MALDQVNEIIDLYAAALSTSVVTTLANRRDSAVKVNSGGGIRRTLLGIKVACGATGHLVGLLDQKPVLTADLAALNALTIPLELNVVVPDGQELSFQGVSSSGTNACAVVALVKREG